MQEKDLLQKAMQQKNMMVLYRDELVAPEYAGVPVAVENELVVLQRQTNFVLDGYCALRTGDITEVEQMDDVPFLKKVMAGEKLYDAVKAPGFACRGWQELLEGIMAQYGGWAAVECEGNPEESLYFLGRQRSQRRFSPSRRMLPQGRYNIIKYIRIVYSGRNGHEEVYQGAGAGVDHAGGE